jgi:FkbM family methyltransferase
MSLLTSVKSKLYGNYRYQKAYRSIPDKKYARFLRDHWVTPENLSWDEANHQLIINNVNIPVSMEKNMFLLTPHSQVNELLLLQKELGARFFEQNDSLYVRLGDLVLNIQTGEELLIIREVYLEGIYNFIPHQDFVVLDIGMNVGFSSLYFAGNPHCKKVFAFEPFVPTYKQALHNISNNPQLKEKIVTLNYGLSDHNETIEVDYSPSNRGSMSVDYWPDFVTDTTDLRKEKINLRSIKEVFAETGIDGPKNGQLVVAKIDCEGAEYPIIDQLSQTGLLDNIDIIMMEWHLKGTEPLLNKLNACGFQSFDLKPFDKYQGKYGFIYAVKTGNGSKG